MAKRIAQTTLNASTLDIINVIRSNASYDYQQNVPKITKATDIPKVGEIICGTPAFANQFINALVNRIALVAVKSAVFYNPYSNLKKGYLEFGETIEEIFVNIANVVDYSAEKAEARELKRSLPDVKSAFHVMNWRVMYPVTIQDNDLKLAFLSAKGVENLIAKIVDSVYRAAEYDEFLLFKYMLIKEISAGHVYPAIIPGTNIKDQAVTFRGTSNTLLFMKNKYNEAGVKTNTPKSRQVIFMDAQFNARFDVEVLAAAFNMTKAEFSGRLYLIDNFTEFDNERFKVLRANSDMIDEVTPAELAKLANLTAVIMDEEWFQVYDNENKFTEKYVGSGLYWNYFYHTWKTFSHSPFSNAVAFFNANTLISPPETFDVKIASKDDSEDAVVFTLLPNLENANNIYKTVDFIQTQQLTTDGIAIQPYGAILIPKEAMSKNITLQCTLGGAYSYTASAAITIANDVDDVVTMALDKNNTNVAGGKSEPVL